MSGFKITWNEKAMADLQEQVNEKMRDEVRAVNASHAGRPVEEVREELERRFASIGIEPSEPNFTEIVEAISDRTMEG